jgi:hypothetical protein
MKPILLLVVFATIACLADDSGKIVTEVVERTKPTEDGRKPFRMETTRRGDTKIMTVLRTPLDDGRMAGVRSYIVGGEIVLMEGDEDGDGHYEWLKVRNAATNEFDRFKRAKDGSVRPVSSEVLALHQELEAAQHEIPRIMRANLEGKITTEQVLAEVERLGQKNSDLSRRLQAAEERDQ